MLIDICVLLNGVSDLSKYLLNRVSNLWSNSYNDEKMWSVITYWFLIPLPFCGHYITSSSTPL